MAFGDMLMYACKWNLRTGFVVMQSAPSETSGKEGGSPLGLRVGQFFPYSINLDA